MTSIVATDRIESVNQAVNDQDNDNDRALRRLLAYYSCHARISEP